ncbi:dUTP diphosphatase [Viridibacillus sp. FSL R5-0477]|uniref:dUTPase n=1 Tax=Viridibacillus arenosi FSL R5-213 TaxID=1227360 RepID=W4EVT8_9BACL|nr:dUTP diphosphatase [Viridibacillus arenosi]ETT84192.1 dUTPase [Viridibacillus arenosi FSL R5-213]OMC90014.1 hypothetical protein BK137_14800 [Viridibacillus arenosi]
MNLTKLFEAQAVLDRDIELRHPVEDGEDRLSKKILALLVELGECANEFRGFKFWSNDQEPRTIKKHYADDMGAHFVWKTTNPLLEEYVDCLHFILSIGNDLEILNITAIEPLLRFESYPNRTVMFVYSKLYREVTIMLNEEKSVAWESYHYVLQWFLELGWLLGFTWEQIEQAYYDKNKINFERQKSGY